MVIMGSVAAVWVVELEIIGKEVGVVRVVD